MPTQVPIEVFRIGKTEVDRDEVKRWMDHIGATEFVIPDDETITDPALLIALAAKRCYMSFEVGLNPNITRVRQDYVDYFDNILASGHGSVLEHAVYNFAIEGISRVFTAEMNRHRAGWAISEGSLRFIRFGDNIPYWEPDSIAEGAWSDDDIIDDQGANETIEWLFEDVSPIDRAAQDCKFALLDNPELFECRTLEDKKTMTRALFRAAFGNQEYIYRVMEKVWADELAPDSKFAEKKQITSMMRRIIGLGVATGGVWSGNIRALRHVFAMRSSPAAEEEMIHVFSRLVKVMADKEPLLFGDFYQDENGFWKPKYVKV